MKTLLTTLMIVSLISMEVFGVAIKRIATTTLTFYNFSQATYDLTDHKLSIGGSFMEVNSLSIQKNGNLMVPAGGEITFESLTVPTTGSVALWYPSTNTSSPMAFDLVDFAQWGAGGQSFETQADAAFIWTAGEFISGNMPYLRTDFTFTVTGADAWAEENPSTGIPTVFIHDAIKVAPNPFIRELIVHTDLPGENSFQLFDITGQLLLDRRINDGGRLTVTTETLAEGMYLIQITSTNGEVLVTKKLLKQ